MKYLAWFGSILVIFVIGIYIVVFTSFGNALVKPILEKKLQEQTSIDTKLSKFILTMNEINILLEVNKNNTISIKGGYSLFSKDMDVVYDIKLENLENLKLLIGTDLKGVLHVDGTIKGSLSLIELTGKSDLASSDTKFEAIIKNFNLSSVKAKINNLELKKLFEMLNKPHYTDGVFSLDADISNAKIGSLDGKVTASVKNALLNSAYITKIFEFKSAMPKTTFNLTTKSLLNGNIVDTELDFNSNLVNLDMKRARFNIENNSIKSDYTAKMKNLDKLFFISQRHMRGSLTINGELLKAKDLDLSVHSKIAGGNIDAKLHNDDLHVELKSVETIDLLHIFFYKEFFKASLNAKVDYDLAKAKGVVFGNVADGAFAKNKTFDLIKKYTKFDMYRESFNGDINANIDKENILASINLRSQQASIKAKDAKINTKTQKIDSDITLRAKKNIISANIKGDINSPKVRVDLEKLMKSKAGERIKTEINKLFKKFF